MDPLYVIIEDGRLSPLSFDSTQSTLIFPAQQVPVEVGNALLHELEDDLAALVEESDSSSEVYPPSLSLLYPVNWDFNHFTGLYETCIWLYTLHPIPLAEYNVLSGAL
nr:unnamed protein product [Callosobruchus analis]